MNTGLLVVTSLAETVQSLLGPCGALKAVIDGSPDDQHAEISPSALAVLTTLDTKHPVALLLRDACSSQHEAFGTVRAICAGLCS